MAQIGLTLAQLPSGLLTRRDILNDHQNGMASGEGEGIGRDLYIDDPTVFQAVPPLSRPLMVRTLLPDIRKQPGHVFCRPDVGDPHLQELVMGVAIMPYRRLID